MGKKGREKGKGKREKGRVKGKGREGSTFFPRRRGRLDFLP